MNNSALQETKQESSKMAKEKCGYNSSKKHGAKFAVVMKLVKWALLRKPLITLMELLAKCFSQTQLKDKMNKEFYGTC